MTVNPDRLNKAFDAIAAGNLRILQLMVRAGIPAEYCDANQTRSLLTHSATHGNVQAFHWLVTQGADPNLRVRSGLDQRELSLLECACRSPQAIEIIEWTLSNAAITNEDLAYSLRQAVVSNPQATSAVTALLEAGAEPDSTDEDGETALFAAVCESHEEVALLLLRTGASPLVRTRSPHRGPFCRKTAFEVAGLNGLDTFCEECLARFPGLGKPPTVAARPKTIAACWDIVGRHLASAGGELAAGYQGNRDSIPQRFNLEANFGSELFEQLMDSWHRHNGSCGIGIFPVVDDAAYEFLSIAESREALAIQLEWSNGGDSATSIQPASSIPFAGNGGGDFLVIDIASGTDGGVSHFSHETERFRMIAPSLLSLLQSVATEIQSGKLEFDADGNSLC